MKRDPFAPTTVRTAIEDFRNLINSFHRIKHVILKDPAKWNPLCSAMDVIGDTEDAISSFEERVDSEDRGKKTLEIYGLFQCLIVQQDAVNELNSLLGSKIIENEELDEIRDFRNDGTGHPVRRTHGVPARSNFLYFNGSAPGKLTLHRAFHDGKDEMIEISPLEMISRQQIHIKKSLETLNALLKEKERQHREEHRKKKLASLLAGYEYCFEKIFSHLVASQLDNFHLAEIQFNQLLGKIGQFKDQLGKRGIRQALPGLKVTLEELDQPVIRMKEYFSGTSPFEPKDILSFATHLHGLTEELLEMAQEIDDEYEKEV